ncbi:adenylyltransferase/cytidyltransferase family protein [Nocardiopsis sp. FR4]|uniref:adenylyltransferase/cytidyltransferase family protein n=1 Tax=Nocardiopsis sp. FR4 TaxID=2605985 RepID=UPI00135A58D8|nr:adenylyltransferase/cytidyltransferase family protein [Nocardiopsis sp. FR4]
MIQELITVVGDTIIDRTAKPLLSRQRTTFRLNDDITLGGVWNSVRALEATGQPVTVITALPRALIDKAISSFLHDESSLIALGDGTTPAPERIWINANNQLIQVNSGRSRDCRQTLNSRSLQLPSTSRLLVQDYGFDVVASVRELMEDFETIVWDPHLYSILPIRRSIVTANARYYATLDRSDHSSDEACTFLRRAQAFTENHGWNACVTTVGSAGAFGYSPDTDGFFCPTVAYENRKVVGAGDLFSAALASAPDLKDIRGSVRTATMTTIRQIRSEHLTIGVHGKNEFQIQKVPIIATGGCFDLLHAGHISLLSACRALGERVVVLMNSDRSVRMLKGQDRPIRTASTRRQQLFDTGYVDDVIEFDEPTPNNDLMTLRPNLFIKGGDYKASQITEATIMAQIGGLVLTVPYFSGISTTILGATRHDNMEP